MARSQIGSLHSSSNSNGQFDPPSIVRMAGAHDHNLKRFAQLIPLSTVAQETGLSPEAIRKTVESAEPPIYHVWSHTYAGITRANKPYCLRLGPSDNLCLDWEDSVVGAADDSFQRRGYTTCRELGTDEHIQCLIGSPDLEKLQAGVNLRDLWAQRSDGNNLDFWIVEAKGKEAGGFDRYCFAEALSQLFEIPAELLSALLGARRRAGHGLCFKFANQLLNGWRERGWHARITLAVLVPLWDSDVIWDGGKAKPKSHSYYKRPYEELGEFINDGTSHAASSRKGESVFGQILEMLEARHSIRALSYSNIGLCFRVLTTHADTTSGNFVLDEFPQSVEPSF